MARPKTRIVPQPTPFPAGEYMNAAQLDWFKTKLEAMQEECDAAIESAREMAEQPVSCSDELDMAAMKIQAAQQGEVEMRLNSRRREILAALGRINHGEYGYCEETGECVGLERLKANPVARLSIEAQQLREFRGRFVAGNCFAPAF